MKRIGVFGGTFDPPHLAHLALAQLAREHLALDELRWVPAGQPWQKAGRAITPAEHRRGMVQALLDGHPRFVLDDRELRHDGPSYTIDTVRGIEAEQPRAAVYLVIGQDQYGRLDTWHDWRELLSRVTLAVAGRAGETPHPSRTLMSVWHRVTILPLPPMDVSSSEIRRRVAAGEPIDDMVGTAVADYIDRHGLYRGPLPQDLHGS